MEEVRNWLRGLGLEHYAQRFEEDGWDTIEILQHMRSSDIVACIDKPGHRRKFEIGMVTNPLKTKETKVIQGDTDNNGVDESIGKSSEKSIGNKENFVTHVTVNEEETHKKSVAEAAATERHSKVAKLPASICGDNDSEKNETDPSRNVLSNQTAGPLTAKENGSTLESKPQPLSLDAHYDMLDAAEKDEATTKLESDNKTSNDVTDFDVRTLEEHTKDNAEPLYDDIINTVCVKGARNKILLTALPTDYSALVRSHEMPSKGNKAHKSTSHGFDQVERTQLDFEQLSSESGNESENEDSCAVANVETVGSEQHLITDNSGQSITKTTIVKDSKNVTIAHKAEVHHYHTPEKKKKRDNFKDQISNAVESHKRKDHLFVETMAFREVEDIINDRHWALITGKPGDGKSSMAAHLMLKYNEKGFEPIILTNAQDWKLMVKGKNDENRNDKQFIMIDDIFGSMSVDDKKVNEWVSMIDFMQRVVEERKGSLVVICTSRAYVFNDVKAKFEKFSCFKNVSCVDLTQEMHALTVDKKKQIWLNYTKEHNVTSSEPWCIYDKVSPHGFPHCVELFCSNEFLRQQGPAFFQNPMQYICYEIQNFKENDKIKYCLLLLILFNGESLLHQLCLSDPPREVIKIFKAAGISSDHAQSELKKALTSLKNTYIFEELDNTYRFSHESIRENVAFVYIKDNPLHAIEDIDLKYLVDHTRCYGYKSNGQESIFVLPSFCTSSLVERIVKEIERGQVELVSQHKAWNDQIFIGKWVAHVLRLLEENEVRENYIQKLLFTRHSLMGNSVSLPVDTYMNLLETLMYHKHIEALIGILQNAEIRKQIQTEESKQILCHAVICACFFLPVDNLILNLLQLGADVNILLSKQELTRYTRHIRGLHHRIDTCTLSEMYNPLLCAVLTENTALVTLFLDNGGSVFIEEEPVVVVAAVQLNLPEVLKVLLEKRPLSNPDKQDSRSANNYPLEQSNKTALAIWNCKFTRFIPILDTHCVLSLIHIANSPEILNVLFQKGVGLHEDILVSGTKMPYCIFRLINGLHIDTFQALLKAGMDVTETWMGSSCLHYFMRTMSRLEFTDDSGRQCTSMYYFDMIRLMPTYRFCDQSGPFSKQGFVNNVDSVLCKSFHPGLRAAFNEMIRQGADINKQDNYGTTPVMTAFMTCTDMDIVEVCVEKRTPKLVDLSGRGYFHYLAKSRLTKDKLSKIVQLLLKSGEDINLRDYQEMVPVFGCNGNSLLVFSDAGGFRDVGNVLALLYLVTVNEDRYL